MTLVAAVEAQRPGVRTDAQLHRLPDGAASARAWWQRASSATIRVVQVEYPQDWLDRRRWRKPARSRPPGAPIRRRSEPAAAIGDIGTHAFNLREFVTGLRLDRARRRPHQLRAGPAAGRQRQRAAALRQRRARHAVGQPGGARQRERRCGCGSMAIRPVSSGARSSPTTCASPRFGEPPQLITRGGPGSSPAAAHASRIPAGHPEGYLEGFAQIYSDVPSRSPHGSRAATRNRRRFWYRPSRMACVVYSSYQPP